MEVQIEETGACARKMSVTIPVEEVNREFDRVLREMGKSVQVPGFRPGKAPRPLLEARLGHQVTDEVQQRLVGGTLYQALTEQKAAPVAMPKIDAGELKRDVSFQYTAEFDVSPDIELKNYKGLDAPMPAIEGVQEAVDMELESMRQRAAELAPVLDRDTATEGDVVLVDYVGTMGGIPFDGGSAQNALIEVGGQGYIPGFAEALQGAKVPGERHVEVDFPEEYGNKELAGKPATFKMTLKELKKKAIPELDDDFAKDLGLEGLQELKDRVTEDVTNQKTEEAKRGQREALLKSLVEANPFPVPESMVREQSDRMVAGAARQIEQMSGQKVQLGPDEIESLRNDNRETAEFQVRTGLLLLKVSEAEGIEIDDQAIDAEIESMASKAGENAQRLRAAYAAEEQRERLRYRLLEDRTIELLLDNSEGAGQASPEPASKEPEAGKDAEGDAEEK